MTGYPELNTAGWCHLITIILLFASFIFVLVELIILIYTSFKRKDIKGFLFYAATVSLAALVCTAQIRHTKRILRWCYMLFADPFLYPEITTFEADGYYVQEWITSFTFTNISITIQLLCIVMCCLLFRKTFLTK